MWFIFINFTHYKCDNILASLQLHAWMWMLTSLKTNLRCYSFGCCTTTIFSRATIIPFINFQQCHEFFSRLFLLVEAFENKWNLILPIYLVEKLVERGAWLIKTKINFEKRDEKILLKRQFEGIKEGPAHRVAMHKNKLAINLNASFLARRLFLLIMIDFIKQKRN